MPDREAARCPYCPDGVRMLVQRESTGMVRGVDFMVCPKCFSRAPAIYTVDGQWSGKQAEAYSAAMKRWVEPLKPMTLREVQCFSECPVVLVEHLYESLEWHHTNYIIDRWAHPDAKMSELYGMTWRCWNPLKGRPTDEERRAVGWE